MEPISVHEADKILREWWGEYGYEQVPCEDSVGRVLAEAYEANSEAAQNDRRAVAKSRIITPAIVGLLTSIDTTQVCVQKLPRTAVVIMKQISGNTETGSHLPDLQHSIGAVIKVILSEFNLVPDLYLVENNPEELRNELARCLDEYDVVITIGEATPSPDHLVADTLESLSVEKLFYGVKQDPGSPLWFGRREDGTYAFGLPGDSIPSFLCLHRYFLPWLRLTLGMEYRPIEHAVLERDITFTKPLQYFMPVQLQMSDKGVLVAKATPQNDTQGFSTLTKTDAFIELPMEKDRFKKGEAYRVLTYSGFGLYRFMRRDNHFKRSN